MTTPGPDGQWPHQPGGGQSGHPQGAHDPNWQPGPGQQPSFPGQPYPQQQYAGQAQYTGQPQQGVYGPTGAPAGGPRKPNRGVVIGLVVALVALVGGGVTWLAVAQSDSVAAGAPTPTAAATNLVDSLGNGDIVGTLSTLAPAEASLFTDPIEEGTAELKRLGVLDGNADPKALSGISLKAENLTFDEAAAEQVNDHLTIAKLTGGTLTVTADLSKIPLAKDFLDASLSTKEQRQLEEGPQTRTLDIAEQVQRSGEPFRIATVNVDGEWYPSLLYTIADYALLDEGKPWPQQPIAPKGADSPDEAVKQLMQAALDADPRRAIELLPPDEMGVLHDVGPALLEEFDAGKPAGGTVDKVETETSSVAGGTRATIIAVELTGPQGQKASVRKNGACYEMTMDGRTEQQCADQLAELVGSEASSSKRGRSIPKEVRDALASMGAGVMEQGLGVITTEVGGQHYVSPIRTLTEAGMTVLRSLQPEDLKALLRLAD